MMIPKNNSHPPMSTSNKIVKTQIIHGMPVPNRGAIWNPTSLDFYMEMKDKLK